MFAFTLCFVWFEPKNILSFVLLFLKMSSLAKNVRKIIMILIIVIIINIIVIIIIIIIIIIIKYQDLAREIKRIWKSRTKVVPVVVGALGSVSKKLAGHLEQIGIKNRTRMMQKSALLGSAHILRKVLEV